MCSIFFYFLLCVVPYFVSFLLENFMIIFELLKVCIIVGEFQVWLGNFMRRWKKAVAARKTSKKTLGEMSLNEDRLKAFHANLRESLKDVVPDNLLNMDETALHWEEYVCCF
jgi:hypothetical protein